MTCIAIKKTKKGFEIAADSQTSWGHNKMPKRPITGKNIKSLGKIFTIKGMTFGCAGSVGDITMFSEYAHTHNPKDMNQDSILAWMIEFRDWLVAKTKQSYNDISVSLIIINEGRAYVVHDWLSSHEVNEFDAIGSGMFIALGAMDVGASARDAVKSATRYDLYCGFEVVSKIVQK